MNDADILTLARTAGCTPKQLEVLQLIARGYGTNRISTILGISTQAVRHRRDGAFRRIRNVEAA